MTTSGSCTDTSNMHFTGKERDSESGLDNFGARYDASNFGRFMSPDPENFGASSDSPQSWNAYSYVMNNPLINIDPFGLDCVYTADAEGNPDAGSLTVVHGDCINEGGKDDGGVFVDNDQNHPVLRSDVVLNSEGTLGLVSYKRTDGFSTGYACIGNCPSDIVQVNAAASTAPTMSAAPPGAIWGLDVKKSTFDLYHMTPEQKARVQACLVTGGAYGGEPLERPEPGQTAAQVQKKQADGTSKPAQYPGNNKPVMPNIKGAKRAPGVSGLAGGLEFVAGGLNCIQNVANE